MIVVETYRFRYKSTLLYPNNNAKGEVNLTNYRIPYLQFKSLVHRSRSG